MKTFPEVLTVRPILSAAGEVPMPGSKSISNRALLLADELNLRESSELTIQSA